MSEDFEALSRAVQIQVDEAFDAALGSKLFISSRIEHRLPPAAANSESAGGFIIESDDPCGFTPSETNGRQPSDDDLISISLIPSALQYLDLPPDDEDVLQVFRNAAGGWRTSTRIDGVSGVSDEERGGTVSRKDWRAVCSVILGGRESEDAADGFLVGEEDSAVHNNSLGEEIEDGANEDGDDEDEAYQASSLSSLSSGNVSDTDSDEYLAEPSSSKAKTNTRVRKLKRTSASLSHTSPTPRQQRASLDAFALFFPSSPPLPDADLMMKRIMFKDIVRVAGTLKEKIKSEEIEEMLSLFSTSPDKSISFDDFTRVMIIAKLACVTFRMSAAKSSFQGLPFSEINNGLPGALW